MTYLIGKSELDWRLPRFGALFPTPQPRYITDGDIAALIPADVPRKGKHKADKMQWRVERYVQPPMTMTTSDMTEDVEFDANGNVVRTTWIIYLGKHRICQRNNLAGVKTYFHHADKREVYDAHMEAKERRKQKRREQAKRDTYLRTRTEGQKWADSWSECTGYGDSNPKAELEWLISYAPDDFDTTVLTDALASIEEALRAYHESQR
jgi:hypothetical protein